MTPREIQEMAGRIAAYLKGTSVADLIDIANNDIADALPAASYEVNPAAIAVPAPASAGGDGASAAAVDAAVDAGSAPARKPSTASSVTGGTGVGVGATAPDMRGDDAGSASDDEETGAAPLSAPLLGEAESTPVVPRVSFSEGATAKQILATLLQHPEWIVANYDDKNVLDQATSRAFASFIIRACALDYARNQLAADADTSAVDTAASNFEEEFNGLYNQTLRGFSAFGYALKELGLTVASGAVAALGGLIAAGYTVTAVEDQAAETTDEHTVAGRAAAGVAGAGFAGLFAYQVQKGVRELHAWRTSDPHAALHTALSDEVTAAKVGEAAELPRFSR